MYNISLLSHPPSRNFLITPPAQYQSEQTCRQKKAPAGKPARVILFETTSRGGHSSAFNRAVRRGTPQQLTCGGKNQVHPAWSPDGTWLAYVTEEGDDYNIRMIPPGRRHLHPADQLQRLRRPSVPELRRRAPVRYRQGWKLRYLPSEHLFY